MWSLSSALSLYFQMLLNHRLSVLTIQVYVVPVSAHHVVVDNCYVGCHPLVGHFLNGALCLWPQHAVTSFMENTIVLEASSSPSFEPLEGSYQRWLSGKTAFLLTVASTKHVTELHVLSAAMDCLCCHPNGRGIALLLITSFLSRMLSTCHTYYFVCLWHSERGQRTCVIMSTLPFSGCKTVDWHEC